MQILSVQQAGGELSDCLTAWAVITATPLCSQGWVVLWDAFKSPFYTSFTCSESLPLRPLRFFVRLVWGLAETICTASDPGWGPTLSCLFSTCPIFSGPFFDIMQHIQTSHLSKLWDFTYHLLWFDFLESDLTSPASSLSILPESGHQAAPELIMPRARCQEAGARPQTSLSISLSSTYRPH